MFLLTICKITSCEINEVMSAGFATEIISSRSIKDHKLDVVMHKDLSNALTRQLTWLIWLPSLSENASVV